MRIFKYLKGRKEQFHRNFLTFGIEQRVLLSFMFCNINFKKHFWQHQSKTYLHSKELILDFSGNTKLEKLQTPCKQNQKL